MKRGGRRRGLARLLRESVVCDSESHFKRLTLSHLRWRPESRDDCWRRRCHQRERVVHPHPFRPELHPPHTREALVRNRLRVNRNQPRHVHAEIGDV